MANMFKFGVMVDVVPPSALSPGWELLEVPAGIHCDPSLSDARWEKVKAMYKEDGRPALSSGFMLSGDSGAGPNYDREYNLFAMERQFKRMNELGIKYAGCWGGHFRIPDGFNRSKAIDQAISTVNIIADQAEKYGMQIALESQAEADTVFPTYLESVEFAKLTGRRCVKVMADLNYFVALNQPMEDIMKYPEYCLDVHIAGSEHAQPNACDAAWEDRLLRLFKILKEIGYDKGVMAACPWKITNDATEIDYKYETDKALAFLQNIREKAYS
jgi:sugar phosphate isomerase/epimerase